MKYRYTILISFLVGAGIFFLFNLFPVSLPNIEGTSKSIWWTSGLDNWYNIWGLIIPITGGLAGTLFTIPFMPKKI